MTAPSDYTALDFSTLSDVMGMLEEIEGFKGLSSQDSPGWVYLDSQHHATIGYGFLLDGKSTNSLGAVLDAITFSGTVTLQDGRQVTYIIDRLINNAMLRAKKGAARIAPHSRAAWVAKRLLCASS